jgi:hypothetical protein
MKLFPYAELAAKSSTEAARDRFAYMTAGNRTCPRSALGVMAGIEGWQKRARASSITPSL